MEIPNELTIGGRVFDTKGRVIYCKDTSGIEKFYEYNMFDDSDKITHYRDSTGYEEWMEYDNRGNLIHIRNSDGFDQWCEYDEDNRIFSYRKSKKINHVYTYKNGEQQIIELLMDNEEYKKLMDSMEE